MPILLQLQAAGYSCILLDMITVNFYLNQDSEVLGL